MNLIINQINFGTDQGREFYNQPMQEYLHNSSFLMYSTHNEGKSVIALTFIDNSIKNDS